MCVAHCFCIVAHILLLLTPLLECFRSVLAWLMLTWSMLCVSLGVLLSFELLASSMTCFGDGPGRVSVGAACSMLNDHSVLEAYDRRFLILSCYQRSHNFVGYNLSSYFRQIWWGFSCTLARCDAALLFAHRVARYVVLTLRDLQVGSSAIILCGPSS